MKVHVEIEVQDGLTQEDVVLELSICLGAVDSEFTAVAEIIEVHLPND